MLNPFGRGPGVATLSERSRVSRRLAPGSTTADTIRDAADACPGDVQPDGVVDFADVLDVLTSWGPCPPATPVWAEPYVGAGWCEHGFEGLTAYRAYAGFDDPDEGVVSVFGIGGLPLVVRSSDGVFHNDEAHDALTAPVDRTGEGIWSNQWDTYVTIGFDDAESDRTRLSPLFGEYTGWLAGDFESENAGWWIPIETDQGRAGNDRRVLLGQFVVAEGETINGVVNLLLYDLAQLEQVPLETSPPCRADLNTDGVVDFADILIVLGDWGCLSGCPGGP